MKASNIIHENGKFWVMNKNNVYYVMVTDMHVSESESSYDSLNVAIIRCDYLASRDKDTANESK